MFRLASDDKPASKRASVPHRSLAGSGFTNSNSASTRSRSAEYAENSPRSHFRCNSADALDATRDGGKLDAAATSKHDAVTIPEQEPIPTLPLCPIADTKNCNCWSEPPHAKFKVRGKTYLTVKNPRKIASGPFLFKAMGADVILTNACSGPTTAIAANYSTILGGRLRETPSFVINFVCPWGIILNYYQIPDLYLPYLRANEESRASLRVSTKTLKPHERAMALFFMGSNKERNSTLKLIPVAVEGPMLVKKMVQGKPALIGQRLPTKYYYHPEDRSRGLADCFEVHLDVNSTDPVGKTACNMSRKYMSSVTVDLGFVIEGKSKDLLPEQMLGCVRLHRIDALKAPTLPAL